MKRLGFDPFTIFETYAKEIRSLLEYAAPVWHSSITKNNLLKLKLFKSMPLESFSPTITKIIIMPAPTLVFLHLPKGGRLFAFGSQEKT